MINAAPPVLTEYHGGTPDTYLNAVSVVFGSLNPGTSSPDFVEAHTDDSIFLDERNGIWRGVSNLAIDGWGRQVGKQYKTDPTPLEEWWLPV